MQRAVRNLRTFYLWPGVHIENTCYFCYYKYDSITVSQSNNISNGIQRSDTKCRFFFRKHAFINKDSWLRSKTITQMQIYLYQSDFFIVHFMKRSYRTLVDKCKKNSTKKIKLMGHCVLKERSVSLINPWLQKSRDPRIQESRLRCPLETFCGVPHFSNQILHNSNNPVYPPTKTLLYPTITIKVKCLSLS